VRFLLLLVLAAFVLGCDGTHLAGTHDVALEYELPPPSPPPSAARQQLELRLAAAHIPADVDAVDGRRLRVTVDADAATSADDLVVWRGGLAVHRADPRYAFAPKDTSGLVAKTETHGDGTIEHYFVGSRAAIASAIRASPSDDAHRVLVEAIDAGSARTRVVHELPALDLADHIAWKESASDRRDVVLYVKDAAKLRAALGALEPGAMFLVLGRRVLSARPLDAQLGEHDGRPALRLPMGDGLEAFERAHQLAQLFRTDLLPSLVRVDVHPLPPSWTAAVLCIVLPLILSTAWIFFVRRFDRAHPEPYWLVFVTFALGGLSVLPAGFLEWALMSASPYLNPQLMTFGGELPAFPIALLVFTLVVGLSEEGSKLLGAIFAARRKEFDEPVDGIVYGTASALGFAAVENIKYFAFGRLSTAIIAARMFTSIPAHLFFGAIWGYALGRKLVSRKTSVLLFLGWAALMHGTFDTLLSIDALHALALVLNLVLASLFIWLLRRALRHGAVPPGGAADAPPSMARAFFPVGRPGWFAVCAVLVHVLALALFVLGVGHQLLHQRVDYLFIVVSSAVVTLLGLCAYGLAATMPLDAAVDAQGVTFAGRSIPWATIRGVARGPLGEHEVVRLDTTGGLVTIGPGRPDRMLALEEMIRGARTG
jgi:protease PrsW